MKMRTGWGGGGGGVVEGEDIFYHPPPPPPQADPIVFHPHFLTHSVCQVTLHSNRQEPRVAC